MHLYTNTYIHLLHINKKLLIFLLSIYILYSISCIHLYMRDIKIAIKTIREIHFLKTLNSYYSICFFNSIPSIEPSFVVNTSCSGCSSA